MMFDFQEVLDVLAVPRSHNSPFTQGFGVLRIPAIYCHTMSLGAPGVPRLAQVPEVKVPFIRACSTYRHVHHAEEAKKHE